MLAAISALSAMFTVARIRDPVGFLFFLENGDMQRFSFKGGGEEKASGSRRQAE
jgi:hypothetical protein